MRNFQDFVKQKIESIYDPKQSFPRRADLLSPEDDDWEPADPFFTDERDDYPDDQDMIYRGYGRNAEYPKAKIGKTPGRGMNIQSPDDVFGQEDVTKQNMSDDDLYKSLQSKLHAGDRLSDDEKMWLSMLARKDIRHKFQHGFKTKKPLSNNPLD